MAAGLDPIPMLSSTFSNMTLPDEEMLETSTSVPTESQSILQEDTEIQEEVRSLLKMIMKMFQVNDVRCIDVQEEIVHLREMLASLLDLHVNNIDIMKLVDIMTILAKIGAEKELAIMRRLIEVKNKQLEIMKAKQEVSSKQQEVIEISKTIASKQREVRHKQEEVRRVLNEVTKEFHLPELIPNPFSMKVLLWNVNGAKHAEIRNSLVSRVVESINPDVVLLQETTIKLVKKIKETPKRKYASQWAYRKGASDTVILYDNIIFNRIGLKADIIEKIIEEKVPDITWAKEKKRGPEQEEGGQGREQQPQQLSLRDDIIRKRMSLVCLKIRGTGTKLIFVSFHNGYKIPYAKEGAIAACELISEIQKKKKCFVIGGADFNHQLSNDDKLKFGAVEYQVTQRRSEKRKVDSIVIAPTGTAKEASVKAIDPFETAEQVVTENHTEVVDHDPLVCQLTIYMPQ